ncbi:MAG TPA: efflux transporter outer membrane subunit [Anaeromyxobacteraceae bacterium]|nr:efflux transporter outer membrane subunit [Anaeromyxobacteraceae bacterium]
MARSALLSRAALGALASTLAACSMAPRYHRPDAPVSQEWPASPAPSSGVGGPAADSAPAGAATATPPAPAGAAPATPPAPAGAATATSAPASDLGWRDVFGDARLQELVRLALENNRDLRQAVLNVELARAQFRIVRADQLPTLSGTASMSRAHTPANASSTGFATTANRYTVGASGAFELDLFGRVRSESNSALEQYFATEEARRAAHLSIVSAVATQYLVASAIDEQLALARQTLEAVRSSYELTKRTYEAGRTSELDLRTAESQVETARFNLASYEQQRAQAENALVLLVGQPLPADLPPGEALASQRLLADLPPGLPSDVLQRRPDILAAEHTLKAANANIGAARAAFFPSISLTAFGGTTSPDLGGLFGSGTGTWSFTPQLVLPLFSGGRNVANLDASHVRKRIEVARYEKAIQVAFREVADALAARTWIDQQLAAQQARVGAESRRYELSDLRYRTGIDSYITVLTAQRDLYSAQQQLIQTRLNRLSNLVDLYTALGGGWLERTASADASR